MADERTFDTQLSTESDSVAVEDFEEVGMEEKEEVGESEADQASTPPPSDSGDSGDNEESKQKEVTKPKEEQTKESDSHAKKPKDEGFKEVKPIIVGTLSQGAKKYNSDGIELKDDKDHEERIDIIAESNTFFKVKGGEWKTFYVEKQNVKISDLRKSVWLADRRKHDIAKEAIKAAKKKQIEVEIRTLEADLSKEKNIPERLERINTRLPEINIELHATNKEVEANERNLVEIEKELIDLEKVSLFYFERAKKDIDAKKSNSILVKLWSEKRNELALLKTELEKLEAYKVLLTRKIESLIQEQSELLIKKEYLEKGIGIDQHDENLQERSKLKTKIERKESSLKRKKTKYKKKTARKIRKGKIESEEETEFGIEKRIKRKQEKLRPKIDQYNELNQEINKKRQSFLSDDLSATRDKYEIESIDQNPDKKQVDSTKKESDESKDLLKPQKIARSKIIKYSTKEKAEETPPMMNSEVIAVFHYLMKAKDLSPEEFEGIRWYMKFHIDKNNIYNVFGHTENKIDPASFLKVIERKSFKVIDGKRIVSYFKRIIKDRNTRKQDASLNTKALRKEKRKEQRAVRKEDRLKEKKVKGNYINKQQLSEMAEPISDYRKQIKEVEDNKTSPKKAKKSEGIKSQYLFDRMEKDKYFYLDTYQLYIETKNTKEKDVDIEERALNYYNKYMGSENDFDSFFKALKDTDGAVLYKKFETYLEGEYPATPHRINEDYKTYLYHNNLNVLQKNTLNLGSKKERKKRTADRLFKGQEVDLKMFFGDGEISSPYSSVYEATHSLQQDWESLPEVQQKERLFEIYERVGGELDKSSFDAHFDNGNITLSGILNRTVPKELLNGGKLEHPNQGYYNFLMKLLKNASEEVLEKLGINEFMEDHSFLIENSKNITLVILNSVEGSGNHLSSIEGLAGLLEGIDYKFSAEKKWEKIKADGKVEQQVEIESVSEKEKFLGKGNFSDFGIGTGNGGTTANINAQYGRDRLRWIDGKMEKTSSFLAKTYLQRTYVSGNTADPTDLKFSDALRATLRKDSLLFQEDLNKIDNFSMESFSGVPDYYSSRHDSPFNMTTGGVNLDYQQNIHFKNLNLKLNAGAGLQLSRGKGTLDTPAQTFDTIVNTKVITGEFGTEFVFNNGFGVGVSYSFSGSTFQGDAFTTDNVLEEDMSQSDQQYIHKGEVEISSEGIKGMFNISYNSSKETAINMSIGTDLNQLFPRSIAPGKYEVELRYSPTYFQENLDLQIPSNSLHFFSLRIIKKL